MEGGESARGCFRRRIVIAFARGFCNRPWKYTNIRMIIMKNLRVATWTIALFGVLVGGQRASAEPSNEETWVVTEVATYLSRVASLSSAKQSAAIAVNPDGAHRYQVTGGGLATPIAVELKGHREQIAVAALAKRDNAPTPEGAWRRALDLHVRMDWRDMGVNKTKAPGTLLEQLEFFRAVANCINPDAAISRLREWTGDQEMVPDWSRIVLRYDCSVESGHFCNDFISTELQDAAVTTGFEAAELDAAAMKRFAEVLNRPYEPKSGDPFSIITTRDWAQHSQRHLMQFTLRQIPWMEKSWGVQEAADEFMDSLVRFLTNLSLFPLVGFECWSKLTDQQKAASAKKAAMLAAAEPWTVVARRWKALRGGQPFPIQCVPGTHGC